jgi:hypothetical protein
MGAARPLLSWLAAAMVAFAALPASAQTTWMGTSGTSWSTLGNWSNGLPSTSVTAVFAGTTRTQPTRGLRPPLPKPLAEASGVTLAIAIRAFDQSHRW